MSDDNSGLVELINECSEVIHEIDRTKRAVAERLDDLHKRVRELQDRILTMKLAEQMKS